MLPRKWSLTRMNVTCTSFSDCGDSKGDLLLVVCKFLLSQNPSMLALLGRTRHHLDRRIQATAFAETFSWQVQPRPKGAGMTRGRQSWQLIAEASILAVNLGSQLRNRHFLPHTQIVRQEESENSSTTFFHCEPFCYLQTSQLNDMNRNVDIEHPASTSQ
jgi:hypothetical protein